MASKQTKTHDGARTNGHERKVAGASKSASIADRGIRTGADFAEMMSALIGDIAMNRIDCRTANAICNAGGKLLKVSEMELRYGTAKGREPSARTIQLTPKVSRESLAR